MAQISSVGAYNSPTIRNLLICQFLKNSHLISVLITDAYGEVKICHRIALNGSAVGWIRCVNPFP